MKMPTITEKDRRVLLLGFWVLLPALFYTYGVRRYRTELADARSQLESEQDALVQERSAVLTAKQNPLLQQTTDSALRALEPRLFEGRDDAIATSELSGYLGEIAGDAHVYLQEAITRPATEAGTGVRSLHVDIRAESDLQGMLSFLKGLEQGGKLVGVERLDISKSTHGLSTDAAEIETLSLTATISGYAMGELSNVKPVKATKTATPSKRPGTGGGK